MLAANRLRRIQRFTKPDYSPVFSSGRKFYSNGFLVIVKKNPDTPFCRLGLAVAKKHLRKATCRNKIKRIVRESFRTKQNDFNSLDFIFLLTKKPDDFSKAVIWKHINLLWKKLDTFYNAS